MAEPLKTPTYVTQREAALMLRCSPDTIKRRIRDGSLPAYRFGRKLLIKPGDLHALVKPRSAGETL